MLIELGLPNWLAKNIEMRRSLGAALYYPLFDPSGSTSVSPAIGSLPASLYGQLIVGSSIVPHLANVPPCCAFDGNNDYISLTTASDAEAMITQAFVANGFSMETWFRTSIVDPGYRHIFFIGNGNAGIDRSHRWYVGRPGASGKLSVRVCSGTNDTNITVADGKWHHIVMSTSVVAGGFYANTNTYLDGQNIISAPNIIAWANMPWRAFSIGASYTMSAGGEITMREFFRGDICHATIYQRELSAADVKTLYRLGVSHESHPTI